MAHKHCFTVADYSAGNDHALHVWDVAFQTKTPVPEGLGSGELFEKTGQHQA